MNTTENNKLIAEFMGIKSYPYREHTMFEFADNNHRTEIDLHYHTSWYWLMPVVGRLSGYDLNIDLDKNNLKLGKELEKLYAELKEHLLDVDIEKTYQAVVEFIKWYNKNKED